jgi:glycosyltransferase involved in cell wall biosynthesis
MKTFAPRIVMLAASQWPARGGVETHVGEVSKVFLDRGSQVTVLTPPQISVKGIVGLVFLWGWVLSRTKTFLRADLLMIHDVFLWFLPVWLLIQLVNGVRQLFGQPRIKVITTFHGWEGTYPPTQWQKTNKWLAQVCSDATLAVGAYIQQFYPIHPTAVVYGGVTAATITSQSAVSKILFLGRLAADTGLPMVLAALKTLPAKKTAVEFWGDGPLRQHCEELGEVKGWVNQPINQLKKYQFDWVIASGYLSVLEALATKQRVLVIADNPLKKAYYRLSPLAKHLYIVSSTAACSAVLQSRSTATVPSPKEIQRIYSWEKLADTYAQVYDSIC